jgi:hypothetical protein
MRKRITFEYDGNNYNEYLSQLFQYKIKKKQYELAVDITDSMKSDIWRRRIVNLLENVKTRIDETGKVLDELRVNLYGGAAGQNTKTAAIGVALPLMTSVADACKLLQKDIRNGIDAANETALSDNVQGFIFSIQSAAGNRNTLGIMHRDFSTVNAIRYTLLTKVPITPPGIFVKNNPLYRSGTLQMLSTCEWQSQCNLNGYYKE